ncbi:hypothetical protein JCGZ_22788 [Jatropha curcas]|uniref:AT-hook motif nuclear-localized protein n=2 Tax=Jatropha curcas TaxID=180498 RepID=A0A067L468_JATCU|nr:hypothetical protein JCGZ_22788 [Jatropha curcas]
MAGDYSSAISLSRDLSHTSDDSSSDHSPRSVPTLATPSSSSKPRTTTHNLHSPVEIQRKPRGRPPGSKNRPKPPIIITKDSDAAMKPAILEISAGSDIIETIVNFARRNHASISVISATGSVSDVTLRHPISHAPSLSFHGPFNLLALTGSFVGTFALPTKPCSSSFGISLAGAQGQVFGGIVAGKVLAASQVVVVAATFLNPTYHRLPSGGVGGENEGGEETKPNAGGGPVNEISSCTGMSMCVYGMTNPTPVNCQMSPDVMHWASPPSRPSSHY